MKLTIDRLNRLLSSINFEINSKVVFIETGTYKGETCIALKNQFDEIYTIEIVPHLYEEFLAIKPNNVKAYLGDSIKLLPDLYTGNNKIIFWLDGHYVSGFKKMSDLDVPLLEELKIINSKYKQNLLILIDDVRLFNTNINENWSYINEFAILETVKNRIVNKNILDDVMIIELGETK